MSWGVLGATSEFDNLWGVKVSEAKRQINDGPQLVKRVEQIYLCCFRTEKMYNLIHRRLATFYLQYTAGYRRLAKLNYKTTDRRLSKVIYLPSK